jgi:hypothetical protein
MLANKICDLYKLPANLVDTNLILNYKTLSEDNIDNKNFKESSID